MRYACVAASAGILLGIVPGAFAREPLRIEDQTPSQYDDVKSVVEADIPTYLEGMQCGGWKTTDTVNGKVATVSGVPGRFTQWNGAIESGMATRIDVNGDGDRNNDYLFPNSTAGLAVSCWDNLTRVTKTVWRYGGKGRPDEVVQVQETYPHPYFTDPSCRWRLWMPSTQEGAPPGAGSFSDQAPSIPLKKIEDYSPAPAYRELDAEPVDRQSPSNCIGFCKYVNTWVYLNCVEVVPVPVYDEEGTLVEVYNTCPEPRPSDPSKPNMTAHFLCTEQPVDGNAESCMPGSPPTNFPNARSCQGQECRCIGQGCTFSPIGDPYIAYFRTYQGSYTRDALEGIDGLEDKNANTAPVACYGFYREFDPLQQQTQWYDRRCVINMDVSGYRQSQEGKGEYGQSAQYPDRSPNDPANQRGNGAYNEENDLWFQRLSGGFSLLNERVFESDYGKDLTSVFLHVDQLDRAQMRATEQLTPSKPIAGSNTIRAFDDTGTGRVLVTWWQKQQQEMASVLHPSTVRIVLPAGWAFGIDPDDPFFQNIKRVKSTDGDSRDERIELQIDADEDILGSAIGYIERSLLLNVREEPVPVVLPMGSASEFRALAEQWCMWYIRTHNVPSCDNAPPDVAQYIQRLEQYADEMENIRLLRGELARYAGSILTLQQSITRPIADWVKQNVDQYRTILQEQENIRSSLSGRWRSIQAQFNAFSGQTNLPWCMNQRYTAPIYSLLDEWLPSRATNGQLTPDGLPHIVAPVSEDIIIDFSTIAYMTGSITLPVLEPIQVRITDVQRPPDSKEYQIARPLPPLPSVEDIRLLLRQTTAQLPKPPRNVKLPPALNMPPMGEEQLQTLSNTVDDIGRVIEALDERYKKFWESIGPLSSTSTDDGRNGIRQMKENLECYGWDSATCQHVEMDLIERFTRIGSRPLVQLFEDYQSRSPVRTFGGACIASDHVCTPAHPEKTSPRQLWSMYGTMEDDFIEELRSSIREQTLPQPVGGIPINIFPSYSTDPQTLLPAHDVPEAIDLSPPRSSASSSTTP